MASLNHLKLMWCRADEQPSCVWRCGGEQNGVLASDTPGLDVKRRFRCLVQVSSCVCHRGKKELFVPYDDSTDLDIFTLRCCLGQRISVAFKLEWYFRLRLAQM